MNRRDVIMLAMLAALYLLAAATCESVFFQWVGVCR
jgi:hypothetical protein